MSTEATEFVIGSEVLGTDGVLGELKRVVIDPIARAITNLVVEPPHHRGSGHLVPIELVTSAAEGEIRLRCNASEFAALDEAEDIQFYPGGSGPWSYQASEMLTLPYYPLMGMGVGSTMLGAGPHAVISDVVPPGEVEVRRGEHVHAADGAIGASKAWSSIPAIIP